MSLTTVNISPILKEMGDPGWDQNMLVNSHPFMVGMETDTTGLSGDYFKIPVDYAKPAGRSAISSVAYDNEAGSKRKAFELTPVSDFLIFRIDGEVVRRSAQANDETSFANAMKREVANALEGLGDNIAKTAYGNTGGSRGQVSTTTAPSTVTCTLEKKSQVVFFYPGMYVCAASTDGTSGSLRVGRCLVSAVSLSAGTLTSAATWTTAITGLTTSDYLFAEGDFGIAPAGLDAWNPASAPGATAFYGVDRSVAPDFLGGMRYDGVALGDSMETVFINAQAQMDLQSGNPFRDAEVYMNPVSMGTLRIAKEGQRWIDDKNQYGIGIKKFTTPSGHVIVEDRDCPAGIARVVGKGCFKHFTNGVQPNLAENDGVEMRYDDRTDKYTGTMVIDHNFGSPKPQGLMRIILPTS